jgi:hypothetical protein
MRIVVGIDPGKSGGVVAISETGSVVKAVRGEQYVQKGEYSPREMLASLLSGDGKVPVVAVLERQHAMPGQGGTSMLSIGVGFGLWWGILSALGIPLERVSAQAWQKEILRGVAGGDAKDRAARVCEGRLPTLCLTPGKILKPHSGLADAGCLALYGLTRLGIGGDSGSR